MSSLGRGLAADPGRAPAPGGGAPRPIVVVEDHLYHVTELLSALAAAEPEIAPQVGVVCLERRGPDTERAVAGWLADHPGLVVTADLETKAAAGLPGAVPLDPAVFASAPRLAALLSATLRPGGLLVQDVQLQTLSFLPADRWWESIYLASTVRGTFAERPPAVRFLSNKRGYEATFGRDLLEAGFDPRDVMAKGDLARAVVPTILGHLARRFPLRLTAEGSPVRLGREDRGEVEAALDLVLWEGEDGAVELAGRAVAPATTAGESAGRPPGRLPMRRGSQEAATWRQLIEDRLAGGPGVPVVEVGARLAPEGALKAEVTNAAARHLHVLRGRLADPAAVVTAGHAYRLAERLAVGIVG
jgi:hypothetical protein